MELVPVLIELWQEVKFWDQLRVATIGADSVVKTLEAVLRPVCILGRIAKNEGASIGLKSLQKEHVCEEGRVADSILESIGTEKFVVHEVHFVPLDAMLFHCFHAALIAIINLLFVLFVENGSDFTEVSVDLAPWLCLFERVEVALVVSEDPWKDRIGTEVIEASRAELV